jgi:hypothetical protein
VRYGGAFSSEYDEISIHMHWPEEKACVTDIVEV